MSIFVNPMILISLLEERRNRVSIEFSAPPGPFISNRPEIWIKPCTTESCDAINTKPSSPRETMSTLMLWRHHSHSDWRSWRNTDMIQERSRLVCELKPSFTLTLHGKTVRSFQMLRLVALHWWYFCTVALGRGLTTRFHECNERHFTALLTYTLTPISIFTSIFPFRMIGQL